MNREQKAAVIDEIAVNIQQSAAIFAVDFRGITVPQAAELRDKLRAVDASFRVVKNSLTERAADQVGADHLKPLLAGPTALTFVRGDAATAAKTVADYARITVDKLAFKGGVMDGASLTSDQVTSISKLPPRDVLYGQLVGLVASPLTGLVRTLNGLVGGLAIQLGAILEKKESGELPAGPPPAAPVAEAPVEAAPVAESVVEAPVEAAPVAEPVVEAPVEVARVAEVVEAPIEAVPEAEVVEAPVEAAPVAESVVEAPVEDAAPAETAPEEDPQPSADAAPQPDAVAADQAEPVADDTPTPDASDGQTSSIDKENN
jgi:large subunit ribosomal protein L10